MPGFPKYRERGNCQLLQLMWLLLLGYARLADSSASAERTVRLGPESEVYKLLRSD